MGPLPGLLVEYLAIGSSSVLWMLFLLLALGKNPERASSSFVVLLIPAVYVLGMVGDFFGQACVGWKRKKIRTEIVSKLGQERNIKFDPNIDIDIELAAYLPRVAEELTMRSSRDRIARGVLVNVPIAVLAFGSWLGMLVRNPINRCNSPDQLEIGVGSAIVIGSTIGLTYAVYRMWARFQRHSYRYQFQAYATLQKLKGEGLSLH